MADGEIVLQRADEQGEPLVNIRFSEESRVYLNDAQLDIAKVMIQAGIQAAAHLNEQGAYTAEEIDEQLEQTLH